MIKSLVVPDVKLCAENEKAPIFSGTYLHAELSGVAGGASAYTINVILYVLFLLFCMYVIAYGIIEDREGTTMPLLTRDMVLDVVTLEVQPDASIVQSSPVQNTWYTVVDIIGSIRLSGIAVSIADTNETLEVKLTMDGNSYTGSIAATAGTSYRVIPYVYAPGTGLLLTSSTIINSNILESKSLKVEVRKTTEAGTGDMSATVQYATRD